MTVIKAGLIIAGVLFVSVMMPVMMALLNDHSDQIDCVHSRADRICSFSRCQPICQDKK
jgi:hypothetical protein